MIDVAIIGGGAAGFFAAINIKIKQPHLHVVIFEKSKTMLGKVSISGGGRCNVTHACFVPEDLIRFYPRGNKELLSVFKRFSPNDTIAWFKERGVAIKQENDGRMFPVTDDSSTIIDCFMTACKQLKIDIRTREGLTHFNKTPEGFSLTTEAGTYQAKKMVISSGSSTHFWDMLQAAGHAIVPAVPSLFTFNIQHAFIDPLQGVAIPKVSVTALIDKAIMKSAGMNKNDVTQTGPLLFTHWGLSGPAILKLSSVAARVLHAMQYRFDISINFSCDKNEEDVLQLLMEQKSIQPKKQLINTPILGLPQRFWQQVIEFSNVTEGMIWADISKNDLRKVAQGLTDCRLKVNGKSTFKEEFVTAGGVDLKEVDFKTMESKLIPGLYFAGEVLNIDALTGGFNFQAAWSEAWVISDNI
ncbi:MAG: NAD(P)/FAD-dependent oxidoreductase [Bacteroidota bacterium]